MSNAETTRATSFANPANTNRSPRSSARACCSSGSRSGPFADDEKPRLRPLVQHQPRGIDEVRIAFGFVQPRHRADREVVGRDAELRARCANLVV